MPSKVASFTQLYHKCKGYWIISEDFPILAYWFCPTKHKQATSIIFVSSELLPVITFVWVELYCITEINLSLSLSWMYRAEVFISSWGISLSIHLMGSPKNWFELTRTLAVTKMMKLTYKNMLSWLKEILNDDMNLVLKTENNAVDINFINLKVTSH